MNEEKLIFVNKRLEKILLKQKKIAKKYKKKDTSFIKSRHFSDLDFVLPCDLENKTTKVNDMSEKIIYVSMKKNIKNFIAPKQYCFFCENLYRQQKNNFEVATTTCGNCNNSYSIINGHIEKIKR